LESISGSEYLLTYWTSTKHDTSAYRTGVADGLRRLARDEKHDEKRKAEIKEVRLLEEKREQELEEQKKRLDRLVDPVLPERLPKKEEPTELKVKLKEASSSKVKIEEVEDEDMSNAPADHDPGNSGFFLPILSLETSNDGNDSDSGSAGPPEQSEFKAADFDDDNDAFGFDFLTEPAKPSVTYFDRVKMPPSLPPPAQPAIKEEEEESGWGSVSQLEIFRETSVALGNEYLKSQGIKVGKGKKRAELKFKDPQATERYREGKKDAEKIDVRGRRIKGVDED
jgi:hypothetical protein